MQLIPSFVIRVFSSLYHSSRWLLSPILAVTRLGFIETGRLRNFYYVDGWSGGHDMTTPDDLHYARFYVDFFPAGITYSISDLADAAYDVLHDQNIRIKRPDDILGYREKPITKVVLEDIYELEEKIGKPTTELKEMLLYRHASKIVELRKYCGHGYHVKSCEGERKSGLADLRTRFPTFHRDLYDALMQVKEEYEEVFEDYKGDWTIRYAEQELKLRAKL